VDVTERPDSGGKLFGRHGALGTVPNITLQSDRNCVTELMICRAARNAAIRVSIAFNQLASPVNALSRIPQSMIYPDGPLRPLRPYK
jgi:hypothetical protein